MNYRQQYKKECGEGSHVYHYKATPEYVKWLEENLEVTEQLLKTRERLLDEIPECPEHGRCVAHALKWIQLKKGERLNDYT